jgi:protein gp37
VPQAALANWRGWPLPNVWLGTSVEDQEQADKRIPELRRTPAAVRWISAEPLLGDLDIDPYLVCSGGHAAGQPCLPGLDLVIVGGESGPKARVCDIGWIRSIRDQCAAANVACFVKQLGSRPVGFGQFNHEDNEGRGVSIGGDSGRQLRHSHGGDPTEWPEDLRVRQMPGGSW